MMDLEDIAQIWKWITEKEQSNRQFLIQELVRLDENQNYPIPVFPTTEHNLQTLFNFYKKIHNLIETGVMNFIKRKDFDFEQEFNMCTNLVLLLMVLQEYQLRILELEHIYKIQSLCMSIPVVYSFLPILEIDLDEEIKNSQDIIKKREKILEHEMKNLEPKKGE